MTEFLKEISLNIISAGAITAAAIWFLKKYIDRKLESIFKIEVEKKKLDLTIAAKYKEKMIEATSDVLPEIQQVVYRARNLVRDTIESDDHSLAKEFQAYCYHLTENLYKYQLFLPKSTFDLLHTYKKVMQRMVTLFDEAFGTQQEILAHESNTASPSSSSLQHDSILLNKCKDKFKEMDSLYQQITDDLRNLIMNLPKQNKD